MSEEPKKRGGRPGNKGGGRKPKTFQEKVRYAVDLERAEAEWARENGGGPLLRRLLQAEMSKPQAEG